MNVTIEDYSERAIAVFGETKSIRNRLTDAGGKFNPSLKGVGDSRRPGWIFPKKQQPAVQKLIDQIKLEIQQGTFVSESDPSSEDGKRRSKPEEDSSQKSSLTPVANDKLSAILARLELVETKLAAMEKIMVQTIPPKTNTSKAKDWADEEDEDSEPEEPKKKPTRLLGKK